jgi:DNA-directed RNA polymerase specialized sigma24 family protein
MPTPPPTQESFDKLLRCLHPDRERAGEQYELLRLKLLEYFRVRACSGAEEQTDETLNRLAKKVADGEEIRDILRYCYGLARWVWREYLKKPEANRESLETVTIPGITPPDPLLWKERKVCFQYCLQQLPAGEKELVVEYWDHEHQPHREARKAMAERRQLTLLALRIRVCRIRDKLKTCFSNCVEKGKPNLK